MPHDASSPQPPRRSPTAWRWMLSATALLFVLSLWVPSVPSESPEHRQPGPTITVEVVSILLVATAVAVLALPAGWRTRLVLGLALLGASLLALTLETPIRRWLGPPWYP